MKPVLALLVALFALPGALALVSDPIQNDAGSGHDAGDSAADATLLGAPFESAAGSYTGMLVPIDDTRDWYAFPITQAGGSITLDVRLNATLCGAAPSTLVGSARVALVDPRGEIRKSASLDCAAPAHLQSPGDAPGIWRLAFALTGGPAGPAGGASRQAGPDGGSSPLGYGFDLYCQPWC